MSPLYQGKKFTYDALFSESLVNISKLGLDLHILKPADEAIQVKAGDVIGWVKSSSSGDLSFETTMDNSSFFYPSANTATGSTLQTLPHIRGHQMKHLLRAHVSQPSLASVNCNFINPGNYAVAALVKNSVGAVREDCFVSVQVKEDLISLILLFRFSESPSNSINSNFLGR